jgi:hypothetical protein
MSGLYIKEIFLQLINLYWRVIGVCIDVVCTVDFVQSRWENAQEVEAKHETIGTEKYSLAQQYVFKL